ncbi:hypothetical protein RHMOL_Rhmol12G0051400 [Rhododendron molle]|uniref:Uncharacterized protein n=1 Tax=Rhododendron molle TaxID=49168 RepID=A0ACC0LER7_RHOML|nr:hypothetical protein RHMOL_Rhmol12G0051400 [Rhododendron molle]
MLNKFRCYAWEESFQSKVRGMRKVELSWFQKAQLLSACNNFMLNSIPVLVMVPSFGLFMLLGGDLTPSRAFTCMSLFAVLRLPLNMLPNLITQGEKPTLLNINLDIPVGSLVAVVGGTGEEKTSLILAMIGELPPVDDSTVVIRGTVAYVPQISWIFNATVWENILFGSNFETSRYWKAIDVTALQHDLDLLLGRDLTEIGEKGVNISPGQKQWVSMAMAVYSNADVYIFDDPLSALDAHVGRQNIIRFLATASKKSCKRKPECSSQTSCIFFLRWIKFILINEGMVKEEGTFEELSRSGIFFQNLMENAEKMEEHVDEKEDDNNSDFKSLKSADSVMQNGLPESGNPKSTRKV